MFLGNFIFNETVYKSFKNSWEYKFQALKKLTHMKHYHKERGLLYLYSGREGQSYLD